MDTRSNHMHQTVCTSRLISIPKPRSWNKSVPFWQMEELLIVCWTKSKLSHINSVSCSDCMSVLARTLWAKMQTRRETISLKYWSEGGVHSRHVYFMFCTSLICLIESSGKTVEFSYWPWSCRHMNPDCLLLVRCFHLVHLFRCQTRIFHVRLDEFQAIVDCHVEK